MSDFGDRAVAALGDSQLRANLRHATTGIRVKRAGAVRELADWEELREAGRQIKATTLAELDRHLVELERNVVAAGGQVHWAPDAESANRIVASLISGTGARSVLKVKSMLSDEIGLNDALAAVGIAAVETDLAELIVQLAEDRPSHILVPAIHRNRAEIRALFARTLPGAADVGSSPQELAAAARRFLREQFLDARVAVSGANFAIAETGSVCVVESEGNGRMCTTLPETLITIMGIEKVIARFDDLEVMLQLLPRSSTAERMNPYTTLWTGVTTGDGPQEFHLVLVDAGRSATLADPVGRDALRCIRCAACLNVCPVYERTGGHAYESTYPGPIGAILAPQLSGLGDHTSLPWASSLCGACLDVCPVKIDIPRLLVHLRGRVVHDLPPSAFGDRAERIAMRHLARVMTSRSRYERAQRAAQRAGRLVADGERIERRVPGPLGRWTQFRDLRAPAPERFRDWWRVRETAHGRP